MEIQLKMNWEIYKKLTLEQREEWKFKYNCNLPYFNMMPWIVALWLIIGQTLSTSLIILKEYVPYSGDVLKLIQMGMYYTKLMLIVCVIVYSSYLMDYFWIKHKEKKWLKEIGVLDKK